MLNPIEQENARPGTAEWQLTRPARRREIEGYASLTSVNRGGTIQLFVNAIDPTYTLEVFRMGWYGGLGARRMMAPVQRLGLRQRPPTMNPVSGLLECIWDDPYQLRIPTLAEAPDDWLSGVYLVKLTGDRTGIQSYIIFVVRHDQRPSDYLFQSSVATYQAYNNWGGKSLYNWNSRGRPAFKVSFNRPYAISPNPAAAYGVGAGEFLTNLQSVRQTFGAGWEYNMVRWLEREGYDVTYATDVDSHANSRLLLTHRALLVVGHDEYWSWAMRQHAEAARDAGIGLGFFGANVCYWQIRFEPSLITGGSYRTIVAYKERAALDPVLRDRRSDNDLLATTRWRDRRIDCPEAALVGIMYAADPVQQDLVIAPTAPDWVLADTDLQPGATLPGLLGYEVDQIAPSSPANIVAIAHSPYRRLRRHKPQRLRYADATVYRAASGATVFAAGTMQWTWGLDRYGAGTDTDVGAASVRPDVTSLSVQQMTRHLLAQLIMPAEARPEAGVAD